MSILRASCAFWGCRVVGNCSQTRSLVVIVVLCELALEVLLQNKNVCLVCSTLQSLTGRLVVHADSWLDVPGPDVCPTKTRHSLEGRKVMEIGIPWRNSKPISRSGQHRWTAASRHLANWRFSTEIRLVARGTQPAGAGVSPPPVQRRERQHVKRCTVLLLRVSFSHCSHFFFTCSWPFGAFVAYNPSCNSGADWPRQPSQEGDLACSNSVERSWKEKHVSTNANRRCPQRKKLPLVAGPGIFGCVCSVGLPGKTPPPFPPWFPPKPSTTLYSRWTDTDLQIFELVKSGPNAFLVHGTQVWDSMHGSAKTCGNSKPVFAWITNPSDPRSRLTTRLRRCESEWGGSTHANNRKFLCVRPWKGTCFGRRVLLSSFFFLLSSFFFLSSFFLLSSFFFLLSSFFFFFLSFFFLLFFSSSFFFLLSSVFFLFFVLCSFVLCSLFFVLSSFFSHPESCLKIKFCRKNDVLG